MLRNKKLTKVIAGVIAVNILVQSIFPVSVFALTSGPGSPEFSSFEPVATTDMVNLFSGDFNYNLPVIEVPGSDGGGYSMSLSYHSGASSEEEASWVGFGWTLNPGAINRNTRGFPDDYYKADVKQYNKSRTNWSVGMTNSLGFEFFSVDTDGEGNKQNGGKDLGLSMSESLRFNNYQGFSLTKGFGVDVKGLANIGMNAGAQGATYSAGINVAALLNKANEKLSKKEGKDKKKTLEKVVKTLNRIVNGKSIAKLNIGKLKNKKQMVNRPTVASQFNKTFASTYGITSFSEAVRSTATSKYTAKSYNWSTALVVQAIGIGMQTGVSGTFSAQKTEPESGYKANGYMNNPARSEYNDNKLLSDYYVEKANPYSKRDIYLGIPFNNADNFMVTGEGVGGGFRFYPERTGHHYPNNVKNQTEIYQMGFELTIGQEVGIGLDFGYGNQNYKIDEWDNIGEILGNDFQHTVDTSFKASPGIFRFTNDMGGSIAYDAKNDLRSGKIYNQRYVPGTKSPFVKISDDIGSSINLSNVGRSSYIVYNPYGKFRTGNRFNKSLNKSVTSAYTGINDKSIAEIGITNENGYQHIYGLPVYNRNETNLQTNVDGSKAINKSLVYKSIGISGSNAYSVDPSGYETLVGEIRPEPYASNYQLTQILTPDYVDVNGDGCDEADFGGWTQFYYYKKYGFGTGESGQPDKWYNWSTPYNGLNYNKNDISDIRDDLGSVSCGQKEVAYLKAIETKTHIAFFVTNKADSSRYSSVNTAIKARGKYLKGSGKSRNDGLGAANPNIATGQLNSNGIAPKSSNELEYLEKIVLFAKNRPEKPLKTVHFAYDYSQVKNLPNNLKGSYPKASNAKDSGKLTLKRVWFEYEDIVSSQTSPFEFEYQYKTLQQFPDYITAKYNSELSFCNKYSQLAQNPDYSPYQLDPWGNVQRYGQERKNMQIPWVYQGPVPAYYASGLTNWAPSSGNTNQQGNFDPACWQLKQIKLPSGGEILVEYEEKDYAYVQDRKPMAMARLLKAENETTSLGQYSEPSYIIDIADLGLDGSNTADITAQKKLIEDYFAEEKIYFKYLYSLKQEGGQANLDNCLSEYITGYASVKSVETVPFNGKQQIKINLKGTGSGSGAYTNVPRQACFDYYVTHRNGNSAYSCQTDLGSEFDQRIQNDSNDNSYDAFGNLVPLFTKMRGEFNAKAKYDYISPSSKAKVGTNLNLGLSFLKLPMLKPKKGGGIRVKRLLMYDPGIETGDAALYGQEYLYQDFEEDATGNLRAISSGVATNEPSEAREENPLVTFLPRKEQSWYSRTTTGEDKEQTEGPIGETLLPAPSIGHSRVVVKNIHSGQTGTGYTMNEFLTVKDYPFDMLYEGGGAHSDFDRNAMGVSHTDLSANTIRDYLVIPAGLFYYEVNKEWAAQGYRFIQNSMHGMAKRTASYAGTYNIKNYWEAFQTYTRAQLDALPKVEENIFEYFEPGENIPVMNSNGIVSYEMPGKEMDITMEARASFESTMDISLEVDLVFMMPGFMIKPTAALSFSYTDRGLSTHVTSKVLRYPAILKKTVSFKDGISATSENLAFSNLTGKPVVVKTYDSYDKIKLGSGTHDGSLYTFDVPAAWFYKDMGRKSDSAIYSNQLSASAGKIVSYGKEGNPTKALNGFAGLGGLNVINASFQTYDTGWFKMTGGDAIDNLINKQYGLDAMTSTTNSKAFKQLNRIRRPAATYVYRDNIKADTIDGIAGAGTALGTGSTKFVMFNAGSLPAASDPYWIRTNLTTKYTPNGNAVEDANALNIYSSALMGYDNILPAMVAQNARYGSIYFDDFEHSTAALPKGLPAHSGLNGMKLSGNATISNKIAWSPTSKKGAVVKVWAYKDSGINAGDLKARVKANSEIPFTLAATSGLWSLYEATVPAGDLPATAGLVTLELINSSNAPIYLDDLRFQPRDAQGICYVYDARSMKLICQFDDQHFGLYYQYNAEGKLIRKLIETERGIFTVQETQYQTPKKSVQ